MNRSTITAASIAFALILSGCGSAQETQVPRSVPSGDDTKATTVAASLDRTSTIDVTMSGDFTMAVEDTERPQRMAVAEVSYETRVVKVTTSAGEVDELAMWVEIPEDWKFDADKARFSLDSNNWLEIVTSCDGTCEPRAWDQSLFRSDGFATLALEDLGGSFIGGGLAGSTNSGRATYRYQGDNSKFSASYHYHNEASRFVGCTVSADHSYSEIFDEYSELCEEMHIDWGPLIENSPEPAAAEVIISPEVEAVQALVDTGGTPDFTEFEVARQTFAVDDDDDARTVSMLLPTDANVRVGSFGADISLGSEFSIFSDLEIDDGCDGICAAKDWETELNGPSGFIGRRRAKMVPDHDAPMPDGWILSGWDDDEYTILVIRWNDDASRYFKCDAELDDRDAAFAADVIALCLSAKPNWLS